MLENSVDSAAEDEEHERSHDEAPDMEEHHSNHIDDGKGNRKDQGSQPDWQLYKKENRLHGISATAPRNINNFQ